MSVWKRILPPATVFAVAIATFPACNSTKGGVDQQAATSEQQVSPTDPVERVNGKAITRIELDRAVKILLAQNQGLQPSPQVVQQARQAALDQLVAGELLYQAAGKAASKEIDLQVAQRIAASRGKYRSEEEFQKTLGELHMTLQELQDFTRKDVVINDFIARRFASRVTVSEAEARACYQENRDRFQVGDSVRASHILVGVDQNAPAEVREKAREKAVALLNRVKRGEDFAEIAKHESTCPSKAKGGDLGHLTKGQTAAEFEKAAFALKAGETSDVVETPLGYHIIKVIERHPAHLQAFDDVKRKVQGYLKREKTLKMVSSFLAELRSKARIERV